MGWGWLPPLIVGFVLGLVGSYLTLRLQRRWQKEDEADYTQNVLEALVIEIEQGVRRVDYMIRKLEQQKASFSRIYTGLWECTRERLAATLNNVEILTLLHQIYHRFDLINFNFEHDRSGPAAAFAKQYLDEIAENLAKLKDAYSRQMTIWRPLRLRSPGTPPERKEHSMRLEDDGLVIEAGPGSRREALEYGAARFREREKTKRLLIAVIVILLIAAGFQAIFAPEGREFLAYIISPVMLLLALGAIGVSRFVLMTPAGSIKAED